MIFYFDLYKPTCFDIFKFSWKLFEKNNFGARYPQMQTLKMYDIRLKIYELGTWYFPMKLVMDKYLKSKEKFLYVTDLA
jgi:hypothetical protein